MINVKIALITFSTHTCFQDSIYSMFEELQPTEDIWTIGLQTPEIQFQNTSHNLLVDAPKKPGISKDTFKLIALFKLIKEIKKQQFDVIYFESLHIWNLIIMIFCRKPRIYHAIHDVIPHKGDKHEKTLEIMYRFVTKLTDRIILRNVMYKDYFCKKYSYDPSKISIINLWCRFFPYKKPTNTKTVLFFGRINPYKGLDNLIKIIEKCPEIQFNVVGRVEPGLESNVAEIKKNKNVNLVTRYIEFEEMHNYFFKADWIILPYESATQSGVIMDAYKHSRPVISFDVGAISEQVIDGNTGFLVEEGNIDMFVSKLRFAISLDNTTYSEMTLNAFNFGRDNYSAESAKTSFTEILKDSIIV